MSSAAIVSDREAWISARAAAGILGTYLSHVEGVLLAAGVRRKVLPGRCYPTWLKADVEKLRDSCVVGAGIGASTDAGGLTGDPGAGDIGGSENAIGGPYSRGRRSRKSVALQRLNTPDASDNPIERTEGTARRVKSNL